MVKADDYVDVSAPQYSVEELRELAERWTEEQEAKPDARVIVRVFLEWLQEQDGE